LVKKGAAETGPGVPPNPGIVAEFFMLRKYEASLSE
jgi:hypothetical protein